MSVDQDLKGLIKEMLRIAYRGGACLHMRFGMVAHKLVLKGLIVEEGIEFAFRPTVQGYPIYGQESDTSTNYVAMHLN